MAYKPIESYGVIGNMRTAALIGRDGAIDWFCVPNFDSPSVFAAILDDEKGGTFQISPVRDDIAHRQFYWPDTNVLVTRYLTPDGVGEVTDFMAVGTAAAREHGHPLVRRVSVSRGQMTFHLACEPAFDYARQKHRTVVGAGGAIFSIPGHSLSLASHVPLSKTERGCAADFTLSEGEWTTFVLESHTPECVDGPVPLTEQDGALFNGTVQYWRTWISKSTYTGRWREMVERSALALKLLTFEPTGAIVAAPTCGLPELVGGTRQWDYRYTWIRDAAFTLYGLLRIGFTEEAAAFMEWLEARCHELDPDSQLQIVYGIDGRHNLEEITLDHLAGYKGSRPVRIGNGAYKQLQLDIYGEMMDSVYLYNKYGSQISSELWGHLRQLLEWVCDHWRERDEGIWEVRSGRQNFVYSKLMCWVALDRGLRLADKRSFPANRARWLAVRDDIYESIQSRGWSESRHAFVQSFGSESLDASNLLMPLVFFMSPDDPRMLQTIDAIHRSPREGGLVSDSLVYRYDNDRWSDGVGGREGTFNMCTFWLVEAHARAGHRSREHLDTARVLFERMLGYASPLGLFGEQTGMSGEALGNFPQAFTHLSLISAAFNLDRRLGARRM